jgi:hypothetical protein
MIESGLPSSDRSPLVAPPPLKIEIQFQYMPDDLYEMLRPREELGREPTFPPWVSFLVRSAIVLFIVGDILYSSYLGGLAQGPRIPKTNLWLALGPCYFTAGWFALLIMIEKSVAHFQRRGSRLSPKQKRNLNRAIVIAGYVLLFLAVRWLEAPPFPLTRKWTPALLLGASLAPWLALFLYTLRPKANAARNEAAALWRSSPAFQRVRTVRIDHEGIHVTDKNFLSTYRWAHFREVWETMNLFVLVDENARRHALPTRAFDESQAMFFRSLAGTYITRSTFLLRRPGFPVVPVAKPV